MRPLSLALAITGALLAFAPAAHADITHIVQRGHTIEAIAHRYRVSVKAILDANHLKDGNHLRPGQTLVIPGVSPSPDALRRQHEKAGKAEAESVHGARSATAALEPSPEPRGQGTGEVIRAIRAGEEFRIRFRDPHGHLPSGALQSFERLMRQGNATYPPDPRLVALVGLVSDHFGGRPIEVVSGYRAYAPTQYAPHSNHNYGRALDFRIEGVSNEALRDFCRTLRNTGCGYYPNSNFVHLDVRDSKAYWVDWSRPGEAPMYDKTGGAADESTSDVPNERSTPTEDARGVETGGSVEGSPGTQPTSQGGSTMTTRDLLENP